MLNPSDDRELKVFISSPSDVAAERASAAAVLKALSAEFAGRFRLVPVLWEQSYYSAHQTFQDAIPKPSSCDLVICILWKRLGTELPPDFNRPDSTTRTGTEYEFEDALEAALRQDVPDIFVYRKRVLIDADRIGQEASELSALNAFWQRWFSDEHGNFTASFDRFGSERDFQDKLARDVRLWLGRRSGEVGWSIAQSGSPFRSLEPFDAGHAGVFFGRRRAIRQAVAKLAAADTRGCPFLLVLGGSGTGKSSLVRAGIIPFLTQERASPDVTEWRALTVRPATLGEDLLGGLAAALCQRGVVPELGAADSLAASMRVAPAKAVETIGTTLERLPEASGYARLILLVDQLEELLLRPVDAREAFIAILEALVRSGKVWVIATLRNDRYPEFQASPALVRLKAAGDSFDLLPPGPAEIREIIEGPARAAGLRFEEAGERNLASILEAAAQERGALPLLQFTLQSLFLERDPASGTLLLSVYERLGGLAGAIAGEAERLIDSLPDNERAVLPGLLLKLVEIEEGKDAASARTLERAGLTQLGEGELAGRMIAGRLLTVDGESTQARLRLAHEALLRNWPRLAELIREHREFLAVRQRIDSDAVAWNGHDRDADFLAPPGRRLMEAADALANRRVELDEVAIAFIDASLAAERQRLDEAAEAERRELQSRAESAEAREQASRRLFRRTRLAVAVVSVLLLAMIGVAWLWLDQREVAQRRAAEAEQNYATAIKAASQNLDIIERAVSAGRATLPVKRGLLKITRDALGNLPSEHETTEVTVARVHLLILLSSLGGVDAADFGRKAVDLGSSLAVRDPTNIAWQDLLQETHYQLGSTLIIAGALTDAAQQYAAAEDIAARVANSRPDDQHWHQLLQIDRRGGAELMQRRGDLSGALDRYRAIDDHIGTGDVLLAEGDVKSASEAYRAMFEATLDRVKEVGAHANANVDSAMAIARLKLGDLHMVKADPDRALKEYDFATKLGKSLFENKMGNFRSARVLYWSLRGVGDVSLIKGDIPDALSKYQAIRSEAAERLDKAPDTPEWQAEVSEIDERIGDTHLAQGDTAAAETDYRAELALAEKVVAAVKGDAGWQRDVELSHGRLGTALRRKGDLDGAAAEYRTQIDQAKKLIKIDQMNADWQRDLALGWAGLGTVEQDLHNAAAAKTAFDQCLSIEVKTRADPRDVLGHDPHDGCRSASAAP